MLIKEYYFKMSPDAIICPVLSDAVEVNTIHHNQLVMQALFANLAPSIIIELQTFCYFKFEVPPINLYKRF